MYLDVLAKEVIAQVMERKFQLVTAESCTAGAIATTLSRAPGAGKVLQGGFITYSKEMKTKLLGVSPSLLKEKTAVCAEVAEAMARGAVQRSGADIAVAVTGVAGPEPDEDQNPVGLVYCAAFSRAGGSLANRYLFSGYSSQEVIIASVKSALELVQKICR